MREGTATSIRLGTDDLTGEDIIAITKTHSNKMVKAYEKGQGVTIKMSKAQITHNMKVEGGFLGMLAG